LGGALVDMGGYGIFRMVIEDSLVNKHSLGRVPGKSLLNTFLEMGK